MNRVSLKQILKGRTTRHRSPADEVHELLLECIGRVN